MTETLPPAVAARGRRELLSKVPEITIWFWVIKILCTTVGESFADWINVTLGVGLELTALIFTGVLIAVLAWQLSLRRYVPFVYWLTVVVVSVTGTLYTDILTDDLGVPLALSTGVFAALLAVVFGVWWASQRTLSIHSITTRRRELFYWLAILVTFALGTAAGDGILELTGWSPGVSVLLPAGLIIAVVVGWRLGANSVLSFWLAYILTRPLGANLGDWMGFPTDQDGLGWGVATTSIVFLAAILATVIYLSISGADIIGGSAARAQMPKPDPRREGMMNLSLLGVGLLAAGILTVAALQPHAVAAASEEAPATTATLAPGQSAVARFPAAQVSALLTIVQTAATAVRSGDAKAASADADDLEKSWDQAQPTLQQLDGTGWSVIDGRIDAVLTAIRATQPAAAAEESALAALTSALT